MVWFRASASERQLLIAAGALMGMAESLVLLLPFDRRGKRAYALAVARQSSEVAHWAAVVALACDVSGGG